MCLLRAPKSFIKALFKALFSSVVAFCLLLWWFMFSVHDIYTLALAFGRAFGVSTGFFLIMLLLFVPDPTVTEETTS